MEKYSKVFVGMDVREDALPAGTSKPTNACLYKVFTEILKLPDIQQKHADGGGTSSAQPLNAAERKKTPAIRRAFPITTKKSAIIASRRTRSQPR